MHDSLRRDGILLYWAVLKVTPSQIKLLHSTVRYCHVLYCTVLHCTALHCTVLYCATVHCTVLCCAVLCRTVLCCAVLYCTALYCTVLYSTIQARAMSADFARQFFQSRHHAASLVVFELTLTDTRCAVLCCCVL
jgi:hypothetical protein